MSIELTLLSGVSRKRDEGVLNSPGRGVGVRSSATEGTGLLSLLLEVALTLLQ